MQKQAQLIADELHALEAHIATKKDRKATLLVARLHNALNDGANMAASKLGIDVQPLSGGTKPPAQ